MKDQRQGSRARAGPSGATRLAIVIMILGFLGSIAAYALVHRQQLRLVETEFHERAQPRAAAIERELRTVVDYVNSLAALHETYDKIDRRHFSSFAGAILKDHPAIQVLGFNLIVTSADRLAHEQAMRDAGLVDYRITERNAEGQLVPAGDRPIYVVVTYPEPFAENAASVGFDIASEPIRRAAVEESAVTGDPVFTARIRLVQERENQFGALICVAVSNRPSHLAESQGLPDLSGVAVGAIRYGDILDLATAGEELEGIHYALFDQTSGSAPELIYEQSVAQPDELLAAERAGFELFSHQFTLGHRQFVVRGTPSAIWLSRIHRAPTATFVAGLLLTTLVAGYVVRRSVVERRLLSVISKLERADQRQAGFERMLDDSHDEFFVFDATTLNFVHANRGAIRNLGYEIEEMREMTPVDLKHRLSEDSFATLIQPLRDGTKSHVIFTTVHRRKDGSEYEAEVRLHLSSFDSKPTFIAMVLDITERQQLDERLRQSQRIEALGTLAGGIAHDFNNILTAIMGYAELALTDVAADPRHAANLNGIVRASERARDVVRRILTFSRKRTFDRNAVELTELVSETLKLMRASLPASIELRERLGEPTTVLGDAAQLHQVLMNLCTNSGHAMRNDGGLLEITLDTLRVGPSDGSDHDELSPGLFARILVKDSGHGIPSEIAEHIFEPFFTTKRDGEGSGMGLAVSYGIVAAHGGTIRHRIRIGRGATFEILLPVVQTHQPTAPATIAESLGGTETILLVDDEQPVVQVMHEVLARAGYEVESFSDPCAAFARFREVPNRFDLVITDYTMPILSGLDLARQIKKIAPDLPVILASGFGESLDEATQRRIGIDCMMAKPPGIGDLRAIVRSVLDGGASYSSANECSVTAPSIESSSNAT